MGKGQAQGWARPAHDGRTVCRYRSAALGDTLDVTVIPPVLGQAEGAPVIYVLDPFLTLDTVAGWARVYGRYAEGAVPPAFVVGVGHATDDEAEFLAKRIRDFTPTPVTGRDWRPRLGAGNGWRLLDAFADEVFPMVEETFGAGRDRTVVGWSLGGLFALTALFHRTDLFSRYLVVGPSLWWENGLAFAWEAERAAAGGDLAARLFLAVGAEEQSPGAGWLNEGFPDETIAWFRQVSNFRRMVRRLRSRGYPGLRFDSVAFSGEYHMTVYPAAVARGLVKLFAPAA